MTGPKVTIVKNDVLVDGVTLSPEEARRTARYLMDAAAGAEGGPCKLEIGDIPDALFIMVALGGTAYVAGLHDMDPWVFSKYFPDAKHAMGYHHEDDGAFYAFWVEDCFCPPIYIVRGRSFENAYEAFVDTFSDYVKIDQADLKDFDEDTLSYTGQGVPYDSTGINGVEVTPMQVGWKLPATEA